MFCFDGCLGFFCFCVCVRISFDTKSGFGKLSPSMFSAGEKGLIDGGKILNCLRSLLHSI